MKVAAAKPLALEYQAHGQASGWRKGEDLIDALPYLDALAPDMKKQVDALIEEEQKRSTKKPADYLREMPALSSTMFEGHPLLAAEYERQETRRIAWSSHTQCSRPLGDEQGGHA